MNVEEQNQSGLERSAGGWKDLIDCEALKRTILEDRERVPPDEEAPRFGVWDLGVKWPLTRREIYDHL